MVIGKRLHNYGKSPFIIYIHCLVVWNMNFMAFHILGIVIPTDYFSEGWPNHQPDGNVMITRW